MAKKKNADPEDIATEKGAPTRHLIPTPSMNPDVPRPPPAAEKKKEKAKN